MHGDDPLANAPSEALKNFVQQRLTTVDQVDIVMLLMKEPSRSWTAAEVAAAVGTAAQSAAMRLFLLASAGVILFEPAATPSYQYVADDPATDALLHQLAALYDEDREAVAALVENRPPDPIRSFADAFKVKK